MKAFDVAIIGSGLAGLQCAKLLSAQGASVLLVDRKNDLTKGIHTTGIFVRKTFEDFEFPPGTLGRPIRDVTLYSPALRSVELDSEHDEFRVGKMGLLYQCLLDECVAAGVVFANKTRFVGATSGDGWNRVKLETGGIGFEITAKVLVGADGANSRVAKALGLDENKEWIVGYEEVFHSRSSSETARLHCFLDAKLAPGYLAWIADDGEEVHVGVGGYAAGFDPRKALVEFKNKTSHIFDSRQSEPVESRGGRIPVGGVLRRIANENGVLLGDAAGAVSPLTAGGLDPCLRLSAMAAGAIHARLQSGDPKILTTISGERFRSRFVSRIWMRRIIARFTSQRLLELGCFALRRNPGRWFAKHVFFGRGSFPDVNERAKLPLLYAKPRKNASG